jgi:hypothetical protein
MQLVNKERNKKEGVRIYERKSKQACINTNQAPKIK